ncbi:MAG: hypothetical protein ACRC1T_09750 [Clostridium chrysemydis]|uniref:hypothetical protein n=1 Tax=Clostridium chrysemydis TaxID=2665504 RepID=UPI003F403114
MIIIKRVNDKIVEKDLSNGEEVLKVVKKGERKVLSKEILSASKKVIDVSNNVTIIVPRKEDLDNVIPQHDLEYLNGLRNRLKNTYTDELLSMNRVWVGLHCYLNVYLKTKKNPIGFMTYMRVMGEENLFELYKMTKDNPEYQ